MPDSFYTQQLAELQAQTQYRHCKTVQAAVWPHCLVDDHPAVDFCSNNYLGLAQDDRLKQAAIQAIQNYGTGAGASPLVSGSSNLMQQLQQAVTQWKQTEAALMFNSGYQANVAILQGLLTPQHWVFADKLNHASLVDGCLLSGARLSRYAHLDCDHLQQKLAKAPAEALKWIVTDSVFSMDGDCADLPKLARIAQAHNAFLLIDEAHASGVFGNSRFSGLAEAQGLCQDAEVSGRILQMGTFSKALGGSGAYVAGSRVLIETLVNRARGFIYSTAPSPANLAAALAAIQIIQADPAPRQTLWQNVQRFATLARQQLPAGILPAHAGQSPIIPIILGSSPAVLAASQVLLEAGFYVQAIRSPTVPVGTERLRITLSARHTSEQIEALVFALAPLCQL